MTTKSIIIDYDAFIKHLRANRFDESEINDICASLEAANLASIVLKR